MEITVAGDIMIPLEKYPHLLYWNTIEQALEIIANAEFEIGGIKSLPRAVLVFNDSMQLLGTIRRRDILRGLEPDFLTHMMLPKKKQMFERTAKSNDIPFTRLLSGIVKRGERPISDIMQPIARTVDYNDHIMKVIYEMVYNNLSLIPVTKDEEVVGLIRTVEVIREANNLFKL